MIPLVESNEFAIYQTTGQLYVTHKCSSPNRTINVVREDGIVYFRCDWCGEEFKGTYPPNLSSGVHAFIIQAWASDWLGVGRDQVTVEVHRDGSLASSTEE